MVAAFSPSAGAPPTLPQPDKDGWMKLFRGDNKDDWYIAYNGDKPAAQSKVKFPDATFSILGKDTLKSSGSPGGQVYFNQSFSHYRVRYQMHFPRNQGNCGMLLHAQENDPTIYGFPPSMESQGDPYQGMGQLWPIGDVWVTLHAKTIDGRVTYDPSAPEITYGGKDWGSRVIAGKDGWARPEYTPLASATGWVTQEADVHGGDSISHLVDGIVRIKYRQPVVSPGGRSDNVKKTLTAGLLGWQSEGTEVWYRNIEIKLYPEDPLFKTTYLRGNARHGARTPRVSGSGEFFDALGKHKLPGAVTGKAWGMAVKGTK